MTSSTNHSNHSTLSPTPSTPAPNFSFKAPHSSKLQCSPRPTLPTSSRRHRSQVRALALPCPPFPVCLKLLAPSRKPKSASKSPREVDPPNSSNSSTGTPEVPKARNGRAWKWRSAAACGRWAVPCPRRTHPQALIRGPNDWRAICSSSQSGMSLPSRPPPPPLSIPLLQKSSRHLPLWATERTSVCHHAPAYASTSRAPGPKDSVGLTLRMCLAERRGLPGASRGLSERLLCYGREVVLTPWREEITGGGAALLFSPCELTLVLLEIPLFGKFKWEICSWAVLQLLVCLFTREIRGSGWQYLENVKKRTELSQAHLDLFVHS